MIDDGFFLCWSKWNIQFGKFFSRTRTQSSSIKNNWWTARMPCFSYSSWFSSLHAWLVLQLGIVCTLWNTYALCWYIVECFVSFWDPPQPFDISIDPDQIDLTGQCEKIFFLGIQPLAGMMRSCRIWSMFYLGKETFSMSNKSLYLVIAGIVFVLILVIIGVLYCKCRKKTSIHSKPSTDSTNSDFSETWLKCISSGKKGNIQLNE